MSAKDAYYFKHDANARHDPKIEALKTLYGMEGYGRYWVLVEILREQSKYILSVDKFTIPTLARQWMCSQDEAQEFLDDLAEVGLIKKSADVIYSESLLKRMEAWENKKQQLSERGRKAAKARWKSDSTDEAEGKQSESNAQAMHKHTKSNANKSIEEKSKEDIYSDITKFKKIYEQEMQTGSRNLTTSERKKLVELINDFSLETVLDSYQYFLKHLSVFTERAGDESVDWFHKQFNKVQQRMNGTLKQRNDLTPAQIRARQA